MSTVLWIFSMFSSVINCNGHFSNIVIVPAPQFPHFLLFKTVLTLLRFPVIPPYHQYQSYVSRSFLKRQQMQLWKKNLLWLLVNYCPSYSVWQDYKDFSKERNWHSNLHTYFHQQWKYFEKVQGSQLRSRA